MFPKNWLIVPLLVLSLLVTACGGAAAPEETPKEDPEASATSADAPAGENELATELSVYNWADYIDEQAITQYEEIYGVDVIYDTFASNEDLLAKLQAGATGYDVIFPSDYMVEQMIALGMLAELDKNNIPNMANLGERFLNAPYDPGNVYCMPYQWGTTGISYRTDVGLEPPTSWAALFDPAEAEKWAEAGGINFLNDQRELIAAALKYKGYSLNDKDEAHLNEAKEVILAVKPLVKTFNSEDYSESLMIPGEVAISHSWNGQAATAYWETYDEATGTSQWAYVIPSEGAMIYQDNMCIPVTSQRKATAEHFINYLLEPEVGAAITNVTYYASANEAAKPFVSEEILNDPSIYPPEEVMNKLEWAEKLDETMFVYDRIWTEIKSQ